MSIIVKPYTFSAGAVIVAAEHNSNFDTLYSDYNGGITNANLSASAAIALSKIAFTTTLAMSGAILKLAKGADVASVAGAITLGDDGNFFDITGTNAITSITAKTAGTMVMLQFDSTASLTDGSNLKLAGNFTAAAESTITLVSDGTNWFEVSRSPAYTATTSNALAGSVVQTVRTITSTYASLGSTQGSVIDNSKPQNTEGNAISDLDTAITPTSATNRLIINTLSHLSTAGGGQPVTVALFQDATADALACGVYLNSSNATVPEAFQLPHTMTAGTTSATTFKLRAGDTSAGNAMHFNGTSTLGGAAFNGCLVSHMIIQEIKV